MTNNDLKEKLLRTDKLNDCEWLDKYVDLIISNLQTKQEKFVTQKHHIIPKCYFKFNNLDVDNSKDNIVNLKYTDHALAHLYFAAACNDGQLRHRNMKAVDHVLGNVNFKKLDFYNYEKDLIINSTTYQEIYATTKEYWSKHCNFHDPNVQSKEQRRQNGLQNKGRLFINNGTITKFIKPEDLSQYLELGWKKGNLNNGHKGRKHMWKDDHQLFVKQEDIEKYLQLGYKFGDKPNSNSHKHKGYRTGKLPWNAKKVINKSTGQIFNSIKDAKESFNGPGNLGWAIKFNKKVNNCYWAFYEEKGG